MGSDRKDLANLISKEIGISSWLKIDQARINQFADVTEDHQFIHVDVDAAGNAPFGGTIAHGFLTLSLLTRLCQTAVPPIDDVKASLNYGFNSVRFLAPVPAGSDVRARVVLNGCEDKDGGRLLLAFGVTIEIRGAEKPALVAEWLTMLIF